MMNQGLYCKIVGVLIIWVVVLKVEGDRVWSGDDLEEYKDNCSCKESEKPFVVLWPNAVI